MIKTLKTLCITTILMLRCGRVDLIACSCINDFKRIKSIEELKTCEFVALVKLTPKDSLRKTYSRIQYSRWGKIEEEYLYHLEHSTHTSIFYHNNGQVRTVNHFKDYTTLTGHYQEYDPEGNPTKSWDYDANGKPINIHIPK